MKVRAAVFSLLLLFCISHVAAVVPYEGMKIEAEYLTEVTCVNDEFQREDTSRSKWVYQDISGSMASVRDLTDEETYAVNLQTRELSENGYTGKTTQWINTDVEVGDTVRTGLTDYTVESISDKVKIEPWGTVEAIRIEGERVKDIPSTTRPSEPYYEETVWYDRFSGLFLKRESTASLDIRSSQYGWIGCEVSKDKRLVETGQDTSKDGRTDFEQILEERESPLVRDVSLSINLQLSSVSQYEPVEISTGSREGVKAQPTLYLDGEKIANSSSVTLSLENSGRHTLEARQENEKVNRLTYDYQDASETLKVNKRQLSETEKTWKFITGIFSGLFESGEFDAKYLVVSPSEAEIGQEVEVSVKVENSGTEGGERTYILRVNGTKEKQKTVELDSGESRILTFKVQKQDTGYYPVKVGKLEGGFKVGSGANLEIESLDISPDRIAQGESAEISVKLMNTGSIPGERKIELKVDGETVERRTVYAENGKETTETFSLSGYDRGTYSVQVGNMSQELEVRNAAQFRVENISIEEPRVALGETIDGTVRVKNRGGVKNTRTLTITAGSEVVREKEIALDSGEETEVDFSVNKDVIGRYNISAGGMRKTVAFKPYIWKAVMAESYDSYSQEIGTERDVFQVGETGWAVFKYSLAKDSERINANLKSNYELYGPEGELVWSTSESFNIYDSQDHISWAELPMTENSDTYTGNGHYTLKFEVSAPKRGVDTTKEIDFKVE